MYSKVSRRWIIKSSVAFSEGLLYCILLDILGDLKDWSSEKVFLFICSSTYLVIYGIVSTEKSARG